MGCNAHGPLQKDPSQQFHLKDISELQRRISTYRFMFSPPKISAGKSLQVTSSSLQRIVSKRLPLASPSLRKVQVSEFPNDMENGGGPLAMLPNKYPLYKVYMGFDYIRGPPSQGKYHLFSLWNHTRWVFCASSMKRLSSACALPQSPLTAICGHASFEGMKKIHMSSFQKS